MKSSKVLLLFQELICKPCSYRLNQLVVEDESADYQAAEFRLNDLIVKFRNAKVTPTKVGLFVTFWKRNGKGPIQPFDVSDPIDLFVVSVEEKNNFGVFVFNKLILQKQGILSQKKVGGKRALRVYPPWTLTVSAQAKKTQAWQSEYFIELNADKSTDVKLFKKILTQ